MRLPRRSLKSLRRHVVDRPEGRAYHEGADNAGPLGPAQRRGVVPGGPNNRPHTKDILMKTAKTPKTVLITGCSSGYGAATARYCHEQGWNVVATMRSPHLGDLPKSDRLRVLALDVTKPASIAAAIDEVGPIDVVVNNAGIGVVGAFEATPMSTIREVFETNAFGVMAVLQAVVPQFRERQAGVIVNVTSSATLAPMPLASVYTASKIAIEGLTASLAHELAAFNVRVKLIEPGYGPSTRFTANGAERMQGLIPQAYQAFAQPIFAAFAQPGPTTTETDVAEAVWRAANDETGTLRFPAGPDALALAKSASLIKVA